MRAKTLRFFHRPVANLSRKGLSFTLIQFFLTILSFPFAVFLTSFLFFCDGSFKKKCCEQLTPESTQSLAQDPTRGSRTGGPGNEGLRRGEGRMEVQEEGEEV